ncbi:glycosyltransferase family 10 domain-containing protein [Pedobacter sp. UBA5917]|jgi:hypothetical protein|uniref:glycosyltransferase family 10 domain-containing protein n=1 Tax=Pedobacter sp. UBA5917 TaxID=1947061 RepID=UPI0025E567B9|nr:glycosyltransferase family 10 [Pedobacter sp. UBA5917]
MKVKFTSFFESDYKLLASIKSRYCNNKNYYKDLEFTVNDNYDKLVILTCPSIELFTKGFEENKAVIFKTEPSASKFYEQNKFGRVEEMFLPLPFLFFNDIEKTNKKNKSISSITSGLYSLPGQRRRLDLLRFLDGKIEIDIWGNKPSYHLLSLKDYRGKLDNKSDGLWNYRYHFAAENIRECGYFTEKIIDPLLSETLCFYDGCPNLAEFIDERSFVQLNCEDKEHSLHIIKNYVSNNFYDKQLKYIKEQKRRVITILNPLNIIWMSLHDKDVVKECKLSRAM